MASENICQKLNNKFTRFALWSDTKVRQRTLTDVPTRPWIVFKYCIYLHACSSLLAIALGIACFCYSVQNSFPYTEVNCSDGTDVFVPIANLMTAIVGVVAFKQGHLAWNAFLHFLFVLTMIFYNTFAFCDTILMTNRWVIRSYSPRTDANWPQKFAWIDSSIAAIMLLNLTLCGIMTFIHLVYHRDACGWQRQRERALIINAGRNSTLLSAGI
uniref:MARVEL domain-containing protein n=1 Tax=Panagrellus redivivus TaxID=6233 RepID=A0A7E4ZZB8_PANRE